MLTKKGGGRLKQMRWNRDGVEGLAGTEIARSRDAGWARPSSRRPNPGEPREHIHIAWLIEPTSVMTWLRISSYRVSQGS